MMRRSRQEKLLREVETVRGLQCLMAEARAGKAAAHLLKKQDELDCGIVERDTLESKWRSSVTGASLPVDMMRLWSLALLQQDALVRTAESDVQHATDQLERRKTEFDIASVRHGRTRENVQKAARANQEWADDRRLDEVLDQFSRRTGEP